MAFPNWKNHQTDLQLRTPKALNKLGERYGVYGKHLTLQELMPKTHRVLSRAQGLLVEEMGLGGLRVDPPVKAATGFKNPSRSSFNGLFKGLLILPIGSMYAIFNIHGSYGLRDHGGEQLFNKALPLLERSGIWGVGYL